MRAYLPGVILPASIEITSDPTIFATRNRAPRGSRSGDARAGIVLAARIPREFQSSRRRRVSKREPEKTQTEIVAEVLPTTHPAALSGPGFAEEIAHGFPTAVTIASRDLI